MNQPTTRLPNAQVDTLADALEKFAASADETTFHNYDAHDGSHRKLGVQRSHGVPRQGLTTSVTFGLAHETWTDKNFPDRVELIQAWDNPLPDHERFLVTVAETIKKQHVLPKPGTLFVNAAESARLDDLESHMPHGLLLYPYLWGDAFTKVDLVDTRVWFMQLVPIHDDELAFIEKNGFSKFEELLTHDGAYFHELGRRSHVTS